tara:strand:- start:1283 stop:2308 length:1026 start_codon:yes stop_codon:yes gene_type:complete
MKSKITLLLTVILLGACQNKPNKKQVAKEILINKEILASLGTKHKNKFAKGIELSNKEIAENPTNVDAYVGLAETYIILHAFGYLSNAETMPYVNEAYQKASQLNPTNAGVLKIAGLISFLNRDWKKTEKLFLKSIEANPEDLGTRHWYTLYLMAMNRIDEGVSQSDIVVSMDKNNDYLIARSSIYYFLQQFEKMKPLMFKDIEANPETPWAYDWLGMAYNGLNEHDDAIKTYIKGFELSDGTVEVGGGLGHALAQAGEIELAKQIADYYTKVAKDRYLPACQRSFIHLGLGENEVALKLLEQAYEEKSWFLIFMQIEHWYDPIRRDKRFVEIMSKMNFPE